MGEVLLMRVLVACEFSGVVSKAFRNRGHDAWSCDLLDTEDVTGYAYHIVGDVLKLIDDGWDLMIAHPPCTHLARSGARWFKDKVTEQQEAIAFVLALGNANIPRIAIENPIGVLSSRFRKPDQIIHPWMFGHPESKATCLWLKGLSPLKPTRNVYEEMLTLPLKERTRIHYAAPGPDRWKNRSRTYQGIAEAMAEQWGSF